MSALGQRNSRFARSAIDALATEWESARGTRPAPSRAEVKPDIIAPYLGATAVLERRANSDLQFRVAGRDWRRILGDAPRGRPFEMCFDGRGLAQLDSLIAAACASPGLVTVHVGTTRSAGVADIALLPFQASWPGPETMMAVIGLQAPLAHGDRFHILSARLDEHPPVARRLPRRPFDVINGGRA